MRLGVSDHVRHNRATWDAASEEYQAAHDDDLTRRPLAWGAYRIPESELQVLGDVRDKDVLELGCGGAQWSTALTEIGSRCVGLDLSGSQLHHARGRSRTLPLVQANGEQLPFADTSFDVVFCDHGAISFCNPELIIPEAARTLRAGGALAFCTSTPLLYLTWDAKKEKQSRRLQRSYDELGRMELDEDTDRLGAASGCVDPPAARTASRSKTSSSCDRHATRRRPTKDSRRRNGPGAGRPNGSGRRGGAGCADRNDPAAPAEHRVGRLRLHRDQEETLPGDEHAAANRYAGRQTHLEVVRGLPGEGVAGRTLTSSGVPE